MNINVPAWAREDFWNEPPPGTMEFWGFRFPPPCAVGDRLVFRFDKVPVAEAVVYIIEPPGVRVCEHSGRWRNLWKVFWTPDSFRDLCGDVALLALAGRAR
jgi:hypothetical protein